MNGVNYEYIYILIYIFNSSVHQGIDLKLSRISLICTLLFEGSMHMFLRLCYALSLIQVSDAVGKNRHMCDVNGIFRLRIHRR